jgi:hypothetical protein
MPKCKFNFIYMHNITLDIVADYGGTDGKGDLAFLEVKRAVQYHLEQYNITANNISTLSVDSFNTIATGFVCAQLGMNSNLKSHVIFHNTAPRKDDKSARKNNDGEYLAATILPNGTLMVGVNAGYCFSFTKNIAPIFKIKCATAGSQFRSRDVFPAALAQVIHDVYSGQTTNLSDLQVFSQQANDIPDVPENIVAYIDGYGNIKTNINLSTQQSASQVNIQIGDVKKPVVISNDGVFAAPEGSLILARGSSGWNAGGNETSFTEIILRGGSAAAVFGYPKPGISVTIEE